MINSSFIERAIQILKQHENQKKYDDVSWSECPQQECQRNIQQAFWELEDQIKADLPKYDEDFEQQIQSARNTIMRIYDKTQPEHKAKINLSSLQAFMNFRIKALGCLNEAKSKEALLIYVRECISEVLQKLLANGYPSYTEYRNDATEIREKLNKEGPKYPEYKYIYNHTFHKLECIGVIYFILGAEDMQMARGYIDEIRQTFIEGNQFRLSTLNEFFCKNLVRSKISQFLEGQNPYQYFNYCQQLERLARMSSIRQRILKEKAKQQGKRHEEKLENIRIEYQVLCQEIQQIAETTKQDNSLMYINSSENVQQIKQIINEKEQTNRRHRKLLQQWKDFSFNILKFTGIMKKQIINK